MSSAGTLRVADPCIRDSSPARSPDRTVRRPASAGVATGTRATRACSSIPSKASRTDSRQASMTAAVSAGSFLWTRYVITDFGAAYTTSIIVVRTPVSIRTSPVSRSTTLRYPAPTSRSPSHSPLTRSVNCARVNSCSPSRSAYFPHTSVKTTSSPSRSVRCGSRPGWR